MQDSCIIKLLFMIIAMITKMWLLLSASPNESGSPHLQKRLKKL